MSEVRDEISVLIADDNEEFGSLLTEYFNREEDIQVVGVAGDGLQAVDMILSLKPDIVILDIIMPNLDGIGVLEKIAELKLDKKPLFLMLSAIGQDVFIQKAMALGAQYYILKPFNINVLLSRIRQMYDERLKDSIIKSSTAVNPAYQNQALLRPSHELEVEVTNLMRDVGIPAHMVGYQYIREAIIQAVCMETTVVSITKVLYPKVARKFETTPKKVERAIRNAIENAWTRGNPDSIDALFGYRAGFNREKPTNSEFLALMVDRMKLSIKRQ